MYVLVFTSSLGDQGSIPRCLHGIMVKAVDCRIAVGRAITFTFEIIPLEKVWNPFSFQLWVRLYHYYPSRRID